MSLCDFVYSVLLCNSVRKRMHPPYEMPHKQLGGGVFLSHWGVFSLTERTEFTEVFGVHFEPTEGLRPTENTEASPPAPLRMERGVVCEVTPIGLVIGGDGLLSIRRTCRGISVITPLSIRRGVGGEASVGCNVL